MSVVSRFCFTYVGTHSKRSFRVSNEQRIKLNRVIPTQLFINSRVCEITRRGTNRRRILRFDKSFAHYYCYCNEPGTTRPCNVSRFRVYASSLREVQSEDNGIVVALTFVTRPGSSGENFINGRPFCALQPSARRVILLWSP